MKQFNRRREEARRRLQAARPMIRAAIIGFCPVQAEFVFDQRGVYFRARHGDWELAISGPFTEDIPAYCRVEAAQDVAFGHLIGWKDDGIDPWDGYMPARAAEKRILKSLRKWQRDRDEGVA